MSQWINQQRPRSVNNVNVDIFTCLGQRALEERVKSILKGPFTRAIFVAIFLMRLSGCVTNLLIYIALKRSSNTFVSQSI